MSKLRALDAAIVECETELRCLGSSHDGRNDLAAALNGLCTLVNQKLNQRGVTFPVIFRSRSHFELISYALQLYGQTTADVDTNFEFIKEFLSNNISGCYGISSAEKTEGNFDITLTCGLGEFRIYSSAVGEHRDFHCSITLDRR